MEEFKYQGVILKLTEEKIGEIVWERCYLPSGVIIFPITSEKKILLVQEKRPQENPPRRLKLVSGILEEEQTPAENAQREMQEEIGFKSQRLEHFWTYQTTGTVNSTQHFFLAKDLIVSKLPNPDGEDTIEDIKAFSIEELYQMLLEDKLKWSHSILGFWKLWQRIQAGSLTLD